METRKIPYGIDRATGKRVHIDDALKSNEYICEACGQPLIIRAGNILPKFFAHFRSQQLCPLLSTKRNADNEWGEAIGPADGVTQHFPDWSAYIRALAEGNYEEAERIWPYLQLPVPSEEDQEQVSASFPNKTEAEIHEKPSAEEPVFPELTARMEQIAATRPALVEPVEWPR